jgi:hypothetical protein
VIEEAFTELAPQVGIKATPLIVVIYRAVGCWFQETRVGGPRLRTGRAGAWWMLQQRESVLVSQDGSC